MTAYDSTTDWSSLDSLEGVPDIFEPRVVPSQRGAPTQAAHEALNWLGAVLPGFGLALLLAYVGYLLSDLAGKALHYEKSPISPIMLAVVLGLVIRNTIGVPKTYEPGLRLCLKTVLRFGIVLLGLGLSVQAVAKIGIVGLPIIACCIT